MARVIDNLGSLRAQRGDRQEALQLHTRALELRRQSRGNDHPEVADTLLNLGALYLVQGNVEGAERAADEALTIYRARYPDGNVRVAAAESLKGGALAAQGEIETAESLLLKAFEALEGTRGSGARHARLTAQRLVDLYTEQGQPQQASSFQSFLAQ